MSDIRASIVNLSCPIALAPRTRCRSRPHGARRRGLGQVNSAGRDVAEYNLERKRTSSTSSAGLPKRRAADTYPCDASWPGPSWPCMSLDRYTQSTLNVVRHAKKSEVEGEIESQIEYQEVQEGQASSAAQAADGCCQPSRAGACCNESSRLPRHARSRRSGVKRRRGATSFRRRCGKAGGDEARVRCKEGKARCRQKCGCGQGGKQQGCKARRACLKG